ncbi:hypothetical protein [Brevibacillus thermoruber]|uniref:Uncharacterized protein n=1 Tax=Brevibacillus thermoruber TaxID=33942 RepID=A0A9X3TTW4_9BACL|nr:hypothetical protein [Brevibacillus thermoruber]MDA5111006.1 hypothetical protein [Brevibacillus thermoruber]
MSNLKDILKNKVRSSAHAQLIDTNENVNIDVNVNVKTKRKKKFEETHTRQTYYIENDLLLRLNAIAGNEKGEKTRIINEALRQYFDSQT